MCETQNCLKLFYKNQLHKDDKLLDHFKMSSYLGKINLGNEKETCLQLKKFGK